MEFSMKDMYRASIEHATGGRNTVMYDDFGNPNVMVCIPRFDVSILGEDEFGTGVHPAFNVDGKIVNEIWIGKYQASDMGGIPVSLKGKSIINTVGTQQAQDLTRKKGKGWHILTNTEWSALVLPILKRGLIPHGNITSTRRDPVNPNEMGGEIDGDVKIMEGRDWEFIKTGTGPDTYSHDMTPFGVFDLFGNAWELTTGVNIHGCGALIYSGEEDGTPVNRPFIEKVDLVSHDFIVNNVTSHYYDGWYFDGLHFGSGSTLTENGLLTWTNKSATLIQFSDIADRMDALGKNRIKVLKQLCLVPMDFCKKDGFCSQIYAEATYKSIQRGCRNGDGDSLWKGHGRFYTFDNAYLSYDHSSGSCHGFRPCYVSV